MCSHGNPVGCLRWVGYEAVLSSIVRTLVIVVQLLLPVTVKPVVEQLPVAIAYDILMIICCDIISCQAMESEMECSTSTSALLLAILRTLAIRDIMHTCTICCTYQNMSTACYLTRTCLPHAILPGLVYHMLSYQDLSTTCYLTRTCLPHAILPGPVYRMLSYQDLSTACYLTRICLPHAILPGPVYRMLSYQDLSTTCYLTRTCLPHAILPGPVYRMLSYQDLSTACYLTRICLPHAILPGPVYRMLSYQDLSTTCYLTRTCLPHAILPGLVYRMLSWLLVLLKNARMNVSAMNYQLPMNNSE